ncbi:MAG: coproporphyrinogen dehydrogenase HemZ [Eubacteriales bacterium]|nr:coproporphyrinogen dehydrogenase HemZ [Eubacteriales bacterium]MDD4582763.1 coproporphyrinogen dehydrogenase HemZ [Eubacteriales bacterium]
MYNFYFNEISNHYEMMEMVRVFLPIGTYKILNEDPWVTGEGTWADLLVRIPDGMKDRNQGKRYLYEYLSEYTGIKPDWGILTGVRPVKLVGELFLQTRSQEQVKEILLKEYLLSEKKANLLLEIWRTQQEILDDENEKEVGLYIGIPFCPTRCVYCSFPSYPILSANVTDYLGALKKEIAYVGMEMARRNWYPESLYIGGGTPTALDEKGLKEILDQVNDYFDLTKAKEYTVEAGRPDTITPTKLNLIRSSGGGRISINPQSMNEETLKRIGRAHKPEDILRGFQIAREEGQFIINADLIAGLPGEDTEDFAESLSSIIRLKPENITVHTLAVKRASRLKEMDRDYSYHQGKAVRAMLNNGSALLTEAGYRPYYLYRQKQMTGNFENVGYALPGTESLYNIKIMEENQTIIAMGAGGISKVWYPKENRLERVPNVSNYEIYIERIDEMLERKRKGIFQ